MRDIFLTIVDEFSRAVCTIFLLEKKEALNALKILFVFMERQFNKKIKVVRSDNRAKFVCLRLFFAE